MIRNRIVEWNFGGKVIVCTGGKDEKEIGNNRINSNGCINCMWSGI